MKTIQKQIKDILKANGLDNRGTFTDPTSKTKEKYRIKVCTRQAKTKKTHEKILEQIAAIEGVTESFYIVSEGYTRASGYCAYTDGKPLQWAKPELLIKKPATQTALTPLAELTGNEEVMLLVTGTAYERYGYGGESIVKAYQGKADEVLTKIINQHGYSIEGEEDEYTYEGKLKHLNDCNGDGCDSIDVTQLPLNTQFIQEIS